MYTLHSAHVRVNRRNSRWETKDLSQTTLRDLRDLYDEVWLFVDQYSFSAPRAVWFGDLVDQTYDDDPSLTIVDWLTQIDNQTLPFRDEPPRFNARYVKYTHGWMAGYDFVPVKAPGTPPGGGSAFDKPDLHVTKDGKSGTALGQYGLFTINGLYHVTDYNQHGAYIVGGNSTLRRANDNQIGVTSFEDVGVIRCVPITAAMVSSAGTDRGLIKGAYITLPDTVDLENKTVLLVIGGYLQVLSKTYTRVADRSWRVELAHLNLMERYYDTQDELDYSSLGLSVYEANPTLISRAEFESDAALTAYLTLPQSFMVIVDSPMFFQEHRVLEPAGLPGRYYSRTVEPYPVMGNSGRLLEYHYVAENGINVVATTPNHRHNYDFYNRPNHTDRLSDAGRYPALPFEQGQAFYRLMGVED